MGLVTQDQLVKASQASFPAATLAQVCVEEDILGISLRGKDGGLCPGLPTSSQGHHPSPGLNSR